MVRAATATAGLLLAVGLAACGGGGGGSGPGSKQLNLVIGNSLPLSGSSKALGDSGQKASDLAVDRIKQAIDAADAEHTVRTVSEDQGSDPITAAESAKRLVDDDKASCLTGPWSSDAIAQTAQDVVIPSKVLEVAPVPTGQDVADLSDHDLVDSTALPESAEGSALSKAIDQDLGGAQGHSVNVAASNDTYGSTLSQDFIQDWQGNGGTLSGRIELAPLSLDTSSAFSEEAQQITTGSPDADPADRRPQRLHAAGARTLLHLLLGPEHRLGQRPARLSRPARPGRAGIDRRDARPGARDPTGRGGVDRVRQ